MSEPSTPSRALRVVGAAGLLAAGAIGGAVLAGTAAANAATPTSASTSTSTSGETTRPSFPAHGSAAHEALEKPVTGTNATKAKQAAVASVGSGTAGAVTTDVSGSGYEVTVTKSDGSSVEVHLDSSFAVTTGRGPGGGMRGPGASSGAEAPAGSGA